MPHQRELHCTCSGEFQNPFLLQFYKVQKVPENHFQNYNKRLSFLQPEIFQNGGHGRGQYSRILYQLFGNTKICVFNQELSMTHAGNLHINVRFVFTREFNCSELEQFFFDSLLLLGKNSFWGEAPWAP